MGGAWLKWAASLTGAAALGLAPIAAMGQTRPAQGPSVSAPEPLRDAFEALAEHDRKAVQDALIWTGDYKGVADGGYGRGTREALVAFAARARLTPEGAIAPQGRAALLAEAARRKATVDFRPVRDARSGAALSLPLAVLTRRTDVAGGSRWSNAAGSASVETFSLSGAEADLAALYAGVLRTQTPGRQVSYRILRESFFVVSGEDARGAFYIRAARTEAQGRPVVRGYALAYARDLRDAFEPIAIAISSGFDPAPANEPAEPARAPHQAAAPLAGPPRTTPARNGLALPVSDGAALAVLPTGCAAPRIGGRPADIMRKGVSGLALVSARGEPAPVAARDPEPGESVIVLALEPNGLVYAIGRLLPPTTSNAPWRLRAPLPGAMAALVFDTAGALLAAGLAPGGAQDWPVATGKDLRETAGPTQQARITADPTSSPPARARGLGERTLTIACGP